MAWPKLTKNANFGPNLVVFGQKILTFTDSRKNLDFLQKKRDQIWPEIGIFVHFGPGLAGSFGALLVGWLVVVAPGLYLTRHLFTLWYLGKKENKLTSVSFAFCFQTFYGRASIIK